MEYTHPTNGEYEGIHYSVHRNEVVYWEITVAVHGKERTRYMKPVVFNHEYSVEDNMDEYRGELDNGETIIDCVPAAPGTCMTVVDYWIEDEDSGHYCIIHTHDVGIRFGCKDDDMIDVDVEALIHHHFIPMLRLKGVVK